MIRSIKRSWFEVWGEAQAQNQILKGLLTIGLMVGVIQSVALVYLAMKKPILIGINDAKTQVLTVTPPGDQLLEMEVTRAVSGYVKSHYNWEFSQVDSAFKDAAKYVAPDFQKKFIDANTQQIKVAKEKKISQRFYFGQPVVDVGGKRVKVEGDRILLVEGLRAASPLFLEVEFDYGERTGPNPEGIYITGEKLVTHP